VRSKPQLWRRFDGKSRASRSFRLVVSALFPIGTGFKRVHCFRSPGHSGFKWHYPSARTLRLSPPTANGLSFVAQPDELVDAGGILRQCPRNSSSCCFASALIAHLRSMRRGRSGSACISTQDYWPRWCGGLSRISSPKISSSSGIWAQRRACRKQAWTCGISEERTWAGPVCCAPD
jgi:hypothetical protein